MVKGQFLHRPPDPSSALVDAIAEAVERRIMVHLTRPRARLLTVEEAGAYLGRTPGAIRMMQKAGKIQCVKLDERVMFDVCDLDRVIEAAKEGA